MLETNCESACFLLVEFHSSINFSIKTFFCFNFQDYIILLINCTRWITQQPGLFLPLGNTVCDWNEARLEYLLGDQGEGAGCGTRSVAVTPTQAQHLHWGQSLGCCQQSQVLAKAPRACLCYEDNTVFLSLKHVLASFYKLGPPKSLSVVLLFEIFILQNRFNLVTGRKIIVVRAPRAFSASGSC